MERSDEARRLDSLYGRLSQIRQSNRELEAENERLKDTMVFQGKECVRRHEFLCGVKEIEDGWDNCIPECDVCVEVQRIVNEYFGE